MPLTADYTAKLLVILKFADPSFHEIRRHHISNVVECPLVNQLCDRTPMGPSRLSANVICEEGHGKSYLGLGGTGLASP